MDVFKVDAEHRLVHGLLPDYGGRRISASAPRCQAVTGLDVFVVVVVLPQGVGAQSGELGKRDGVLMKCTVRSFVLDKERGTAQLWR